MITQYAPISTTHYVYNPRDAWDSHADMRILADHEEEYGNIEFASAIRQIIFAGRRPIFDTVIGDNPRRLVNVYIWRSYPSVSMEEEYCIPLNLLNTMIKGTQLAYITKRYRAYPTKSEAYLALCYVLMENKEIKLLNLMLD